MRVLHWCVLLVTILLLLCEVTISQLCKSLITLVDAFHTLFIFMCTVLPPPPPPPLHPASIIKPLLSSADLPASPPCDSSSLPGAPSTLQADPPVKPPPGSQVATDGAAGANEPANHQPSHEAAYPVNSHPPSACEVSPPALACGVSYTSSRIQPVGAFLSVLLLASLCVSYLIQIISFSLDPHPVQHPLMLVLVGAVSLLHKTLLLRLNWGQLLNERLRVCKQPETESYIEVNHKEIENASQTSTACESSHDTGSPSGGRQLPVCLLSSLLVIQGLFTSSLALINSLLMLLIRPQNLHGAGTRSFLVYLDPALSLLAVIMLIITVKPQMCRYGLLLLQATPLHVCTSELERRIAKVPGVQAVHDLHIWQLAESVTVASVHVHCSATFPAHRCAELMSGVTKVLRSVGVSCCTVQPEFTTCSVSAEDCECDASPGGHREGSSLPPALACSLACDKACAGSMCCSPRELLAPPAGETRNDSQALVIENTFL